MQLTLELLLASLSAAFAIGYSTNIYGRPQYYDVEQYNPLFGTHDNDNNVELSSGRQDHKKNRGKKNDDSSDGDDNKSFQPKKYEKNDHGKKEYRNKDHEKKDYDKKDYGKKDYDRKYSKKEVKPHPVCGRCDDIKTRRRFPRDRATTAEYMLDKKGCRWALITCSDTVSKLQLVASDEIIGEGINMQFYAKCDDEKWKMRTVQHEWVRFKGAVCKKPPSETSTSTTSTTTTKPPVGGP
ncbi:unnamed protein product [Caenorhabditis auriculariae]|uniref:Uncharacterized protein n=1 Tax=Caenorhabditis auriculariae TaxID=2777116 RepID=A0A8S1H485_9PELO|nr:unnamed protein product [Caenorhabditis auriculariae]